MRRSERDPSGMSGSMAKQARGSIADTIASARASLKNPSRPFTPADPLRRLHGSSLASPSAPRPPPTPLMSSSFEPERPFTSLLSNPLPPPTRPSMRPPSRGGTGGEGGGRDREPQILSLDEDDAMTQDTSVSCPRASAVPRKDGDDLWEQVRGLLAGLALPVGSTALSEACRNCDRLNDILKNPSTVKQVWLEILPYVLSKQASCNFRISEEEDNDSFLCVSASRLLHLDS
jgi:hypothetical protein